MGKRASSLHRLCVEICDCLSQSVNSHSNEVAIIQDFTSTIRQTYGGTRTPVGSGMVVDVEADFIHQKPYAFFVKPKKICNRVKVELGDILFIVKIVKRGSVVEHRGSFSQAKRGKSGSWEIAAHQYEFLHNLSNCSFKFGNSVYATAGVSPLVWNISTPAQWWSHYLLLNAPCNYSLETAQLSGFRSTKCSDFRVAEADIINSGISLRQPFIGASFCNFLYSFFQSGGIGFDITGDMRDIVEIILKRIGWQIDPPEEYEGYFGEISDESGFSVVRFTIYMEE